MKPTYLTHEKHGVHIAYTEHEIKLCEESGWKVYGENPPGAKPAEEVQALPVEIKAKRKYVRKAA